MKYLRYFVYFFFIISPNLLLANFCSDFERYLKNRVQTNEILNVDNWETSEGFGYYLARDINKETIRQKVVYEDYYYPYARDFNNNLVIDQVIHGSPFHEAGIRHFDRLVKVNGVEVSTLTDDAFDIFYEDIVSKEKEIDFTFQLLAKKELFTKEYAIRSGYLETSGLADIKIKSGDIKYPNVVGSILIPIDLIEVRPEKYEFDLKYETIISYLDFDSNDFVNGYGLKNDYESCTYLLSPDENPYIKYNLFNPEINIRDLIEDKSTLKNKVEFDIYLDEEKYLVEVTVVERKVSSFTQDFEFRLFPFETHYLDIYLDPYYTSYNLDNYVNTGLNVSYSFHFIDKLSNLNFTSDFEIIDTEYQIYTDDDIQEGMISQSIVNFIEIKRQSFYFIAKIVSPIFLILLLSWSVFFLKPKDIESRLTVSIICFLSLIAYNFVIEDSIPKLSYYTWMDWYVSLSYIFCGLTTFFTIYDYQLINKNKKQFKITEAMRSSGIFIFILLNIVSFYILRFQEQGYLV